MLRELHQSLQFPIIINIINFSRILLHGKTITKIYKFTILFLN